MIIFSELIQDADTIDNGIILPVLDYLLKLRKVCVVACDALI